MKAHNDISVALNDVIPFLMINYPFLPDPGLLHGKMGGVLLFNHYAKYTGKAYFFNYAEDLFEEIRNSLSKEDTPVNFSNGLCGIGWGMEYLFQNGFTKDVPHEILENIDARIMEWDIRRMSNMSLDTGLAGILLYVVTRVGSCNRQSKTALSDRSYLCEILSKLNTNPHTIPAGLAERLNKIVLGTHDLAHKPSLDDILAVQANILPERFETMPIGIKGGLTGIVLKMII